MTVIKPGSYSAPKMGSPNVTPSLIAHIRAERLTQTRRPRYSFGNSQGTPGKLAQSQGSRVGEPGLGVCSHGGGLRLQCLYPPSPSPTAIRGYGGGEYQIDAKVVILLYSPPTTTTVFHSFLLAWMPLAREPCAELAGGLTSLDV